MYKLENLLKMYIDSHKNYGMNPPKLWILLFTEVNTKQAYNFF